MLIVYRKSDGAAVYNNGTNDFLPDGTPFESEVQNAIKKHGGKAEDYGEYRINDKKNPELVKQLVDAGSYDLAFDGGKPVGVKNIVGREPTIPEPTPKSEIELLVERVVELEAKVAKTEQDIVAIKAVPETETK